MKLTITSIVPGITCFGMYGFNQPVPSSCREELARNAARRLTAYSDQSIKNGVITFEKG